MTTSIHHVATPLTGRVAVITGASSGLGEATAKRLAASGAKVAVLARRADRLDVLVKEIEQAELQSHVTDAGALEWLEGAAKQVTFLESEDVAEAINFLASQPARVNFQQLTIMPTQQAS